MYKKYNCKIESIIRHKKENNFFEFQTNIGIVKGKIDKKDFKYPEDLINKELKITAKEDSDVFKQSLVFFNYEMLTKDMDAKELVCTINSIIFENEEDLFYILNTDKGTIKGSIPFHFKNIKDTEVKCTGKWEKTVRGTTFNFDTIAILENGMYFFLTKVIAGIGPKLAKQLLTAYSDEKLGDILENSPQILLNIKGLKDKKLRKIVNHWSEWKHIRELDFLLEKFGQPVIVKIYNYLKHLKSEMVPTIKENPYRLAEIKSIGFKTADKARDLFNIEPNSIFRIESGIIYCIEKSQSDLGHSYLLKNELFELCCTELNIIDENNDSNSFRLSFELFEEALNTLEDFQHSKDYKILKKAIVYLDKEKTLISTQNYYKMETFILETINRRKLMKGSKIVSDIKSYISNKEKDMGFGFSDEQKEAIEIANEGFNTFTLTGYAGTGKSTISKAIIQLLTTKYNTDEIISTALSGMASNRIKQTTGFASLTIHSLLKVKKDGYEYNEDNKLPYKVILLDEGSMVNTEIFYHFLKALSDDTILILVGDPAQLPPIGAGNVFSDIVLGKLLPGASLTKIYRQSEDAVITYFANFIRNGLMPENLTGEYTDFSYKTMNPPNTKEFKALSEKEQMAVKKKNQIMILNEIKSYAMDKRQETLDLYNNKLTKQFVSNFQIITAMRNGLLGTDNLNRAMQHIFNTRKKFTEGEEKDYPHLKLKQTRTKLEKDGKEYYLTNEIRVRDKVLHKHNINMNCQLTEDYKKEPFAFDNVSEKRVFNGQIGIVIKINKEEEEVHIYYPNEDYVANYTFIQAKEFLDLAYALTIHKTQGSEFRNVVLPIVNAQFVMLNNQLLYTAITRAKENIKVIGHTFAFKKAATTVSSTSRNTILKYLTQVV